MLERYRMNRFLIRHHLYQRADAWLTFGGKESRSDEARLFLCKRRFFPGETFAEMVDDLYQRIERGRAGKEIHAEKEVRIMTSLPAPLLRLILWSAALLNRYNLLPYSLIETDPLFSSVFVTNLGSLGMEAVYHHNFEYGTCGVFAAMGLLRKIPVVCSDGEIRARETFELKYNYDERIVDGYYMSQSLERVRQLFEDAPEEILEARPEMPPGARP